jgi:hypothetical protein
MPAGECDLWPGSYVPHPVAFAWISADSFGEWLYGVVLGYTAQELMTVLHVVCQDGCVRLPLNLTTSVIKVDALNYAMQTGARANPAAVSPLKLLDQNNEVFMLCQCRRSDTPKAVQTMMSVPFTGNDIIPLIRPSNLQLVRVRRQHAVDYETASRSKRPICTLDLHIKNIPVRQSRDVRGMQHCDKGKGNTSEGKQGN